VSQIPPIVKEAKKAIRRQKLLSIPGFLIALMGWLPIVVCINLFWNSVELYLTSTFTLWAFLVALNVLWTSREEHKVRWATFVVAAWKMAEVDERLRLAHEEGEDERVDWAEGRMEATTNLMEQIRLQLKLNAKAGEAAESAFGKADGLFAEHKAISEALLAPQGRGREQLQCDEDRVANELGQTFDNIASLHALLIARDASGSDAALLKVVRQLDREIKLDFTVNSGASGPYGPR
jgi:hypothetical protein